MSWRKRFTRERWPKRSGDAGHRKIVLTYESLEQRQMLAAGFSPTIDFDLATDWSAILDQGGGTDRAWDLEVQTDGKIVVTGMISKGPLQSDQDLMVARYNEDGSIDTSFNGSGVNVADFGDREFGTALDIQSDGKIVAISGFHVARFNVDGTIDTTYTVPPDPMATPRNITDVLAHSSSKTYILFDSLVTNGEPDVLLTRLNSDLTLDSSFGIDGYAQFDYQGQRNNAWSMAEQSDGKIVLTGSTEGVGYFARFHPDGTLDTSYAAAGVATVDTSINGNNNFWNVVLDSSDNAYFVGQSVVSADGLDKEIIVVKADNGGNLVDSFGVGGVFRFNLSSGDDAADSEVEAAIDQNGQIVVTASTDATGTIEEYMIRVTENGVIDDGFGVVELGSGVIRGLAVSSANRPVAIGQIAFSYMDTRLVRVNPNVEFADSFENGQWNGLWTGESQWFTSTQGATEGMYSAEFGGVGNDALLTLADPVYLSSYSAAELRFDWQIERGFDAGEYLKLDFWNGSTWSEVLSLDGNQDHEDAWLSETVQLDSQYLNGPFQFRFRATSDRGNEDAYVDNVVVVGTSLSGPPNEAPWITSSPLTVATEDSLYTYDVNATDPNAGDTITFWLDDAPAGMTINPATGVIQWTPTNDDVGESSVSVRAQDAGGLFDTQSFVIDVANVNDAPTINSSPATEATDGELYTYDVDANDPDIGDTLTYSLDTAPSGMIVDSSTGLIQWQPTTGQIGDHNVTVRAADAVGLLDTQSFTITVEDSTITPQVVFSDSFENGQWNGLWVEDNQNDWFTSTQRATDGNYSAEVDGNANDATLTVANPIDLSTYGGAELSFDWLIENGFDGGEYLALDFWDGSNWIEITRLSGNVDSENTWHSETLTVDPQYMNSDFQFRYRSKVNKSAEDANVDNVKLIANSGALRGAMLGDSSNTERLDLVSASMMAGWAESVWMSQDQVHVDKYELRVADLPGNLLGLTRGNTITIDADGAGMGWFVDATPWESSEITTPTGIGDQYDLLTVLAHELGHLNGHDHEHAGVMGATLDVNTRLISKVRGDHTTPLQLDYAFSQWTPRQPMFAEQNASSTESLIRFQMESEKSNRLPLGLQSNNHFFNDANFRAGNHQASVEMYDQPVKSTATSAWADLKLTDMLFGKFDEILEEFQLAIG